MPAEDLYNAGVKQFSCMLRHCINTQYWPWLVQGYHDVSDYVIIPTIETTNSSVYGSPFLFGLSSML